MPAYRLARVYDCRSRTDFHLGKGETRVWVCRLSCGSVVEVVRAKPGAKRERPAPVRLKCGCERCRAGNGQ